MSHWLVLDEPRLEPQPWCAHCMQHQGRHYYIGEMVGYGDVAICSMCVITAARLEGMSDPGVAESLREEITQLKLRIDELEDEVRIEQQRQIRVVSIGDVRKILDKRSTRRTRETTEATG